MLMLRPRTPRRIAVHVTLLHGRSEHGSSAIIYRLRKTHIARWRITKKFKKSTDDAWRGGNAYADECLRTIHVQRSAAYLMYGEERNDPRNKFIAQLFNVQVLEYTAATPAHIPFGRDG